jgi:hypothetical protein
MGIELFFKIFHGCPCNYLVDAREMIQMITGDWWEKDLVEVAKNMTKNIFTAYARASTVNGLVGDLFNCSGKQVFCWSNNKQQFSLFKHHLNAAQ